MIDDNAAAAECYECGKPLGPGEGKERKVALGANYGMESGVHDPQTVVGARYGLRRICDACASKADWITVLKYALVLLVLAAIAAAIWHWRHGESPAAVPVTVDEQPSPNNVAAPGPPKAPTQLYSATGAPATGVPATGVPATGVPATGVPDPNAPYPAATPENAAPSTIPPQTSNPAPVPVRPAAPIPPAASGQIYPTDPAIGTPAVPVHAPARSMPVETLSRPPALPANRRPVNGRVPYGTLGTVVAPEDFPAVAQAAEQALQYGDRPTPVPWRSPSGQSEGTVYQSGVGADPQGCRQFKVTAMHQDGPHSGYVDVCPGGRFR